MRGESSSKRARTRMDLGEAEYMDTRRQDSRMGGSTDASPDDTIFFLDNGGGSAASVRTPKEKARARVLRIDAIMSKQATSKPFPVATHQRCQASSSSKRFLRASKISKLHTNYGRVSEVREDADHVTRTSRENTQFGAFTLNGLVSGASDTPKGADLYNLWGGKGRDRRKFTHTSDETIVPAASSLFAEATHLGLHQLCGQSWKRRKFNRRNTPNVDIAQVSAVDIDAAGSSYNPPEDARQDVVAKEVGRIISTTLRKHFDPGRAPVPGKETETCLNGELHYVHDYSEEEGGDVNEGCKNPEVTRVGKLSKAQKNKQTRRKKQQADEETNKRAKRQRRDISSLNELALQINKEEEVKRERLARRKVTRHERIFKAPSRLGKYTYQSEPAPVLLTEELTGSLRTVAGTHTLIRERLKSLQRRALVEPRRKVDKTKSKSYIRYQPGEKGERESDMHKKKLGAREN
ncbi:nucleolar protein [Micromonas commoda]|uniref:Ribosome biogenesis protein NOP53 n=1 Tax=Micromonas commoda (strain RCC299 / NOUM17 / CCMP2709) TaxID=296587 RepID=C1FD60_MICCC|nr:nucleolar protein [Micromonas commoda]ACO68336.1 nucleolar protein [Micromonas commoda]|eukprot:XP_002507078.1 nucleolar protein [Micromonas commoda]